LLISIISFINIINDERNTINSTLENALKGMDLREQSTSMLVKISESYRLVFQETGRRFTDGGIIIAPSDIYHCSWSEIISVLKGDWNGKGLSVLVAERKERSQQLENFRRLISLLTRFPIIRKQTSLLREILFQVWG